MSRGSCYCGGMTIGSSCMNQNCDEDWRKRVEREKAEKTREEELRAAGCPYPYAEKASYSSTQDLMNRCVGDGDDGTKCEICEMAAVVANVRGGK